ncbi:MAG: sodium-dependent transporter [Planctomycetia bacterium]|nr:sodium-dependent transporter [Planctomycetia bacterium]
MAILRDRWNNRSVFILASIGSAIGLGNLWRFPYKCYEHGGGAFVLAYLFALFTAGIPLLLLEFGLGNMTQRGAPGAFKQIRKKLEWVGWWAILVGVVIVIYYAVVTGWCINYIYYALTNAWGADPKTFFFKDFLGTTSSPFVLGGLRWPVVIGLAIAWLAIIFAIWRGVWTVGKVIYATVLIPWILLVVFVVRGVTLDGAMDGIMYYITPRLEKFWDWQLWVAAYGQVFYSLSVGFGIMIAYASFLPRKSDLVRSALIIGIADALTAIVGGFAVFGALGYLAQMQGVPVEKVLEQGVSLAFVTYPVIIDALPFGSTVFGVLFFVMLFTLAVDSAFSLTEAAAVGIRDKWGISHKAANLGVGIFCFAAGLIFCTGAGLLWLDIVDHFVEFFGLGVICLVEALIVTHVLKTRTIRQYVNRWSKRKISRFWDVCITYITPPVLLAIIIGATVNLIKQPYEGYPQAALIIGGWGLMVALPVIAFILMKMKEPVGQPTDADEPLAVEEPAEGEDAE